MSYPRPKAHTDTHGIVAELAAEEGEYQKATENFEQVAKKSMNNNLTKYSVKDYLFKAGIVHLASGVRFPLFPTPTDTPRCTLTRSSGHGCHAARA